MKAAVYYGAKDIRVENIEEEVLQDNEVKVKVAWIGICGTDLHEYVDGPHNVPLDKPASFTGKQGPYPLGHEFSGTIAEVGKNVKDINVGDRVVVNPTLTLDNQESDFDAMDGVSSIGFGRPGGYAEFVNVPDTCVIPLDDQISLKDAALVEPLSVSVQAIKESQLQFGQNVAIFGAGPIGLSTTLAAKSAGAKKIIVFDLSEERLNLAKSLGATAIYNSGEIEPAEALKQEGLEKGVDVAFEVAGVAPTFKQALSVTRKRGRMVLLSIFSREISWNPVQLTFGWQNIYPSLGYSKQTFKDTIELIQTNQINASDIVTKEIDLDDVVSEGFEALSNDKKQAKILVRISGEA